MQVDVAAHEEPLVAEAHAELHSGHIPVLDVVADKGVTEDIRHPVRGPGGSSSFAVPAAQVYFTLLYARFLLRCMLRPSWCKYVLPGQSQITNPVEIGGARQPWASFRSVLQLFQRLAGCL